MRSGNTSFLGLVLSIGGLNLLIHRVGVRIVAIKGVVE